MKTNGAGKESGYGNVKSQMRTGEYTGRELENTETRWAMKGSPREVSGQKEDKEHCGGSTAQLRCRGAQRRGSW